MLAWISPELHGYAKGQRKLMNNKFVVVVECAIEHENKFLIIKRPEGSYAGGLLAFPGGKVEEQDSATGRNILLQAVTREVFEEVGLKLEDPPQYVTSSYFIDQKGNAIIDNIFHCKLTKTKININASEREVPEYYWLTYEEIQAAKNSPEWLKSYMKEISQLSKKD